MLIKNNKKLKFVSIAGLLSVLWIIFILYIFPSFIFPNIVTGTVCGREADFADFPIKAFVNDKYIDEKNHASEVLLIQNENGVLYKLYLAGDSSSLYRSTEIGDSIFKSKGTMDVTVNKISGSNTFTVDFGCHNGKIELFE